MKKIILFIMGLVFAVASLKAQQIQAHKITGIILSAKDDMPLAGTSLFLKNSGSRTVTNSKGYFSISQTVFPDTIVATRIGYNEKQVTIRPSSTGPLVIRLEPLSMQLQQVTVSTGYQKIPKERATGSFAFIDNKLLNRSVSPDILSRLKGITSGLLFDHNTGNELNISIRGQSTIFANSQPLIVLDNFVYTGDINDINPNDIESITILKDAAASSIWGARSGNGVIIITTKSGKYHSGQEISFNTHVSFQKKPDLFYMPLLSPANYIGLEEYLFDKGYYDDRLKDPNHPSVSPVVDILDRKREGVISASDAGSMINALKSHDVRADYLKYFYRRSSQQEYALNLKGGSVNDAYYVSVGYDKGLSNLKGNQDSRLTINANNKYALIHHRLQIATAISYAQANIQTNGLNPLLITSNGGSLYPYARLADANGNALSIAKYRQGYIDTVGNGMLLDWNYRPLDEVRLADNTTKRIDYQVNVGINYKLDKYFRLIARYQYKNGTTDHQTLHSTQTYYTRNLINLFSEITTDGMVHHIPFGGIYMINTESYTAQNARIQVNYNHSWKQVNQLTAIAGAQIRNFESMERNNTLYGYDKEHATSMSVDFANPYPTFINKQYRYIPNDERQTILTNRYVSYFLNASYSYGGRYTISVSGRKDASNLFGVNTNQKWVPLWSTGLSWTLSNEKFYHFNAIPFLKLRATYGYNGNIDKRVTALLTTRLGSTNRLGQSHSTVVNPPNPDLRWEKIGILNVGIDFSSRNNRISGSFEYYHKNGKDLFGDAPLAPSSGLSSFRGNTANMEGNGIDVQLTSKNIVGKVQWQTAFLFNTTKNKVTKYMAKAPNNYYYVTSSSTNPREGGPVKAIYSYKWKGLDNNGNPRGLLNGKLSEDYSAIINSTNSADMIFNGSSVPTVFGSLRNTVTWNNLSFSFNIAFKLGYYFRKASLGYYDLFVGNSPGHKDFNNRWKEPGDEKITDVPSLVYPADPARDKFYQYSSVLVEKGGHFRLLDLQLSYDLGKDQIKDLPFRNIRMYIYATNLGLLWKENTADIDPDYSGSIYAYPPGKNVTVGLKIDL